MPEFRFMNIGHFIQTIYARPRLRVLLHLLFWIALLAMQWYISYISFSNYSGYPAGIILALNLCTVAGVALFYYVFVYGLLPQLFFRKRWFWGMVSTLLLLVVYTALDVAREEFLLKPCLACMAALQKNANGYYDFLHLFAPGRLLAKLLSLGELISLLLALTLPLCIKFGLQMLRAQFRAVQLTSENLQLEFNFLRSQLNPHFLFNTLNNLYGLILQDQKDKSALVVARLSEFLRYTLYESNTDKVSVERETRLLKDYIDLESLRLNYTKARFTHSNDGSVVTIAPLLVIPVIENAFKYSADEQNAYIIVDMTIANKQIHFYVENVIDTNRQATATGGIGLLNFNKRLNLYYAGKYTCHAAGSGNKYTVSLNIDGND